MTENWKDIEGYEGLYQVSCRGRVKSLPKQRRGKFAHIKGEMILKQSTIGAGYLKVNLSKDKVNKRVIVSRLVANAFIPNPYNLPTVNHIDGDKTNNSVENLEWMTMSDQLLHAHKMGLIETNKGKLLSNKLTEDEARYIVDRYSQGGIYQRELAEMFGVRQATISALVTGKTWKGVVNCHNAETTG